MTDVNEINVPEINVPEETRNCKYCTKSSPKTANYCASCGAQFEDISLEELLGITITPDDFSQYLIEGYISKKIKINPALTVTIRTMNARNLFEIQQAVDRILAEEKIDKPSYAMIESVKERLDVAMSLLEVNNTSMGADFQSRIKRIDNIGVELIMIIQQKIATLSAAVGQSLQRGDLQNF